MGTTLAVVLPQVGCGLGYIEIVPEESLAFRIENGTPEAMDVTIIVEDSAEAGVDATPGTGEGKSVGETAIRVPSGSLSTGTVQCGEIITVSAAAGAASTTVQLAGSGTGTLGFDSGSIGATGERFLLRSTHFTCSDTVLIKLESTELGQVVVVAEGAPLPDPISVPSETDDPTDTPGPATATVVFRLENATATATDITIAPDSSDASAEAEAAVVPPVRVPPGQYSTGELSCGATYRITATVADAGASIVLLTGDGTGTLGFDSASVGLTGERLLALAEHYACGETIVVRITDDGSGIGLSTSDTPLGDIRVFSSTETVPEPDLPDPGEEPDAGLTERVTLIVVNAVESTVQINFATGSGSLASSGGTEVSSEFDVRVPPGATTVGSGVCAQEYVVAGAHLETTGTTYAQGGTSIFEGGGNVNFHAVVFAGDGTGTEGFDSNSVAVSRGRLLQLGTHFQCGDVITVTVIATNNQFKYDAQGLPAIDESGNFEIKYGVGAGTISVTSGG